MTTILNLPEEILRLIIEELSEEDVTECQKVCRALYIPAHLKELEGIVLNTYTDIKRFVKSIDQNPNPLYLRAVQSIHIHGDDYQHYREAPFCFNKEITEKMFNRFPNLDYVLVRLPLSAFEEFSDEVCKSILKSCSKLKVFEIDPVYEDCSQFYNRVQKLRLVITSFHIMEEDDSLKQSISQHGNITDALAKFPHLQMIYGGSEHLNKFQDYLPLFSKCPNLIVICILGGNNRDDANFAENYFASITKAEQDSLVETLSKVKAVSLARNEGFCKNSIQFISQYLTGLVSLILQSDFTGVWTDSQNQLLCDTILKLICRTASLGSIVLRKMKIQTVELCLPSVLDGLFKEASPTYKRVLHIKVKDRDNAWNLNQLIATSDNRELFERRIKLSLTNGVTLDDITWKLLGGHRTSTRVNNVDAFVLDIYKRDSLLDYCHDVDVNTYEQLLREMKSLKEITVDIPASFKDKQKEETDDAHTVHPLVKQVTLRALPDLQFLSILDRFSYWFPNLKRLNVYYHSGTWNSDTLQYQLELPRYSLDKLTLDMTPVRRQMKRELAGEKRRLKDVFFVINVECVSNSEQHMYKSSFDLKTITRIYNISLKGSQKARDYLRINVTVNSLKSLDLCMYTGGVEYYTDYTFYMTRLDGVSVKTVFNEV